MPAPYMILGSAHLASWVGQYLDCVKSKAPFKVDPFRCWIVLTHWPWEICMKFLDK